MEENIEFVTFTNDDALQIGELIVKYAKEQLHRNIAVHIEKDDYPLFTHYMDGTNGENLYWINAKKNVVKKFNVSSLSVGIPYKEQNKSFHIETGLPASEYQAEGGSIPLVVDKKRIGTITVSGMTGEEDHSLAILGVRMFLEQKK